MQIRNSNGGALADDVELALERVGHQHIRAVADEHLTNDRLFFANDGRHGHGTINRHVTPAENHLAFGRNSTFNFLFAGMTRSRLLRKEDHADAVFAGGRELHALIHHIVAIELIGYLNQDARTVALQGISAYSAAVPQILQYVERLTHDAVALLALDVRNEADAAGVVLKFASVQAAGIRHVSSSSGCGRLNRPPRVVLRLQRERRFPRTPLRAESF